LLAHVKIHTIISNDNNYEMVLTGQKGSMSTFRCP